MNVTTQPLEDRQLSVTIEVDEAQTQQAMQRAARQISKEVRIPGFRQGKAPYDVIVQRFGENSVRREAADLLAEDVVHQALEQEGIDAFAPGQLTNVTLNPITYTLTVPLNPAVDLGDYRGYRLEPEPVLVAEEQVQEALEKIREDHTVFESVERPANWNDGIALDLAAVTDDGTQVLKGDGLHMVLESGNTDPVPGFHEAVLGASPGEKRTFRLILPPDFPQEPYRGQEAEFTVAIEQVYNQIVPELDDDLARTVGTFDSLEELERNIRDRLSRAAQAEQNRVYANQVVEAIIERAHVEFPPVMLERELDRLVAEMERSITEQSRLSMDDFLRVRRQTKEEFREGLSDRARARLTHTLVLGEVVKLEGLKVEEHEIGAAIAQASEGWGSRAGRVRESLDTEDGRRGMYSQLLADKAIRRLVAIAKGEVGELLTDAAAPDVEGAETADAGRLADEGVEAAIADAVVPVEDEWQAVVEQSADLSPDADYDDAEASGVVAYGGKSDAPRNKLDTPAGEVIDGAAVALSDNVETRTAADPEPAAAEAHGTMQDPPDDPAGEPAAEGTGDSAKQVPGESK